MFRQVTAPNRLKPAQPQFFAVLQEQPRVEGSLGMVLATFSTKAPHGERQVSQAVRQALAYAAQCYNAHGRRCRVESVKEDFKAGRHINSFTDVARPGAVSRFGDTIKIRL